jgi:hypothetical protein
MVLVEVCRYFCVVMSTQILRILPKVGKVGVISIKSEFLTYRQTVHYEINYYDELNLEELGEERSKMNYFPLTIRQEKICE